MNNSAIGVFDSGFGGLSIVRAIRDLLPAESVEYFGDSARYPYGPKEQSEVRRFAREISDYLVLERKVKMLVVACNTATAAALADLERRYDVPVVGVISAGVRAATAVSERRRVGVIATVGTVGSGAYQREFESLPSPPVSHFRACPGLVEYVERGEVYSEEVKIILRAFLEPLVQEKVDTLLLGCTHYPFLSKAISEIMGNDVIQVSSAEETAFEVREMLGESEMAASPVRLGSTSFYSSGDPIEFRRLGTQLFGEDLGIVHRSTLPRALKS